MAHRVDTNQRAITLALRQVGASVQPLHTIGRGCPDLLIGFRGINFLLELKIPGNKLTSDEVEWHETWRGQVRIISTIDEVFKLIMEETK